MGRGLRRGLLAVPLLTAAMLALAPQTADANPEVRRPRPVRNEQMQQQRPRTFNTGMKRILDAQRAQRNRAKLEEQLDPDRLLAQAPTRDQNPPRRRKPGKTGGKTATGTNAGPASTSTQQAKTKARKASGPTLVRIYPQPTWVDYEGKVHHYGELGKKLHELGTHAPNGGFPPPWYIEKFRLRTQGRFAKGEVVPVGRGKFKRVLGVDIRITFGTLWRDADTVDKKVRLVRRFIFRYEQIEKDLKKRGIREPKILGQDNVGETLKKLRWLEKNIGETAQPGSDSDSAIDDL